MPFEEPQRPDEEPEIHAEEPEIEEEEEDTDVECDNCGEEMPEGSYRIRTSDDGTIYCPECYHDTYTTCRGCEEETLREDMQDSGYCNSCHAARYVCCASCDEECDVDDTRYDEDACETLCESCYEDRIGEQDSGPIHSDHAYRPRNLQFFGDGPRFLGVELEVENVKGECRTRDAAQGLVDASDLWYLKHDGSLNSGFEIVTQPFSWEWYREHGNVFKSVFALAEKGFRSYNTSTCGMHVHVSRKAFKNAFHLYKFIELIHANEEFTLRVSQRQPDNLRQWARLAYGSIHTFDERGRPTYREETPAAVAKKGRQESNRYCAVNLQNRNTVEVRIFRGTLLEASFRKNLEYVVAACDYTRTAGARELTPVHFTAYVLSRRADFPNLANFLNQDRFAADAA